MRTRTTRKAALVVASLIVLSTAPVRADDGGGSQGNTGNKPGNGGKAAPAPADPVAALLAKVRALFGL